MNRNFNLTDYSVNDRSNAEETTNNSICDKETKELLFAFKSSICKY